MDKSSNLLTESNYRKATARTLQDWKENYNWAIYWLTNFISTCDDLENILLNEVGPERYNFLIYKCMADKSKSFYDVFKDTND